MKRFPSAIISLLKLESLIQFLFTQGLLMLAKSANLLELSAEGELACREIICQALFIWENLQVNTIVFVLWKTFVGLVESPNMVIRCLAPLHSTLIGTYVKCKLQIKTELLLTFWPDLGSMCYRQSTQMVSHIDFLLISIVWFLIECIFNCFPQYPTVLYKYMHWKASGKKVMD